MSLKNRQKGSENGSSSNGYASVVSNGSNDSPYRQKDQQSSSTTIPKAKPLLRRTYSQAPPKTPTWVYIALITFIIMTLVTIPHPFHPESHQAPSINHVFYYGWLTCISTGLGAVPFFLFPDVATFWIGVSNGTLIPFL